VFVALIIQHVKRMRRIVCHLWLVQLYHIFPHYLINGTIFGKTLLNVKCVFWFCLQLLSETFLILRRIQRDIIINVRKSALKYPLFMSDCNETRILSTDFRKILKYQISYNSYSGSRVVPCGRTDRQIDRHDEANCRFSQFCERA
jgi:hypothetical protein